MLHRFDRQKEIRLPFLSAMSMLDARDNEGRSYLEFVDALRRYGASPKKDMHALWRRVVFNILISNTAMTICATAKIGIPAAELDRMASAFEHDDLKPRHPSRRRSGSKYVRVVRNSL